MAIGIENTRFDLAKVTWIVRAQYIENSVPPLFRQLFQSGEALGARRWLASLQRECEYMALLHSSHVSGNCSSERLVHPTLCSTTYALELSSKDYSSFLPENFTGAAMSPMGRRGVLLLAQQMMASFYMAVSGPVIQGPSNIIVNEWRGHTGRTVRMFEAPVRMVIRNCPARNAHSASGEQSFPVLSATTTLWLPGTPPKHIFEYLCNGYCRGEWDTFCYLGAVHELSKVVTSPHLRGNAVSILQPIVRDGTGNSNMLLLQHASTDMSCSLVVYSIVARDVMCEDLDGSNSSIPLLPSGFAILPDGHGGNKAHPAAASSSSAPADQNSNAGSLLTVAFQTLLQSSSYNNDVAVSIDDAGNQICRVIMNILAAVGADIAIPA
ncbi:LOW QUALITY PROTEIN: hypothetical protein U9M48_032121 [Paspalum notatum var. saurae]|uniref:START domain-containing protein n=1 Tax=Paspalum notatum var. saurae TaxID=547442 RepID=A0AAQ3U4G1_PASNO